MVFQDRRAPSLFGFVRELMGPERTLYAFYDEPGLVHDIMETGKFGYNANIVWLLAPQDAMHASQLDAYGVQLNYAKNKLSHYKDNQDLWFEKTKGNMYEPKNLISW